MRQTELAGVVTDANGEPLADVKVDAWTWYPGTETKTDAEGRFLLRGFDRGEAVEVEFTKGGYSPSLYVAQKAGSNNWTIVLTQGTWLEGKVTDAQGPRRPGSAGPRRTRPVSQPARRDQRGGNRDAHRRRRNVQAPSRTVRI